MELLHPGVYIQEVSSGVRPIEGVSTSTVAFLGKAAKGRLDRAVMVTSFIEFQALYGGFLNDSYLAHAAFQFFNNGGRRLYVLRVAKDTATADVGIADRRATPGSALTISASSPGVWGNELEAVIADGTADPGDEFKLSIQQSGAAVEVHDNLSVNPDALNFADNVVNARSRLVRIAVDKANDSDVAGTSTSGATPATSLPADRRRLRIDVNGDGPQTITLANPVSSGAEIAAAIQSVVRALTPLRGSTPAGTFTGFTATFSGGLYVLTSGTPGKQSSVQVSNDPSGNAATLLKLGVTNGGSETTGAAVLRPANGTYLLGDGAVGGTTLSVTLGDDGTTPQDPDYLAAFALLDTVRDVNIIAVPGIGSKAVVESGAGYCQNRMDCFFIGDMSSIIDSKEAAQTFVNSLAVKSSYGAVYFPWLTMLDPTGAAPDPIPVPPSGFVAGHLRAHRRPPRRVEGAGGDGGKRRRRGRPGRGSSPTPSRTR